MVGSQYKYRPAGVSRWRWFQTQILLVRSVLVAGSRVLVVATLMGRTSTAALVFSAVTAGMRTAAVMRTTTPSTSPDGRSEGNPTADDQEHESASHAEDVTPDGLAISS